MPTATALRTENTAAVHFDPRFPAGQLVADRTVPTADELHASVYGATAARADAAIYRRRRIVAGLALVLVGALIWTLASFATGIGDQPVGADLVRQPEPQTIVVQPGDTLWSIAAAIDTDGDIRDTVDRLADLNGGAALTAGQRLVLD